MFVYIESSLIILFEILCCKLFYGTFGTKRYQDKDFINIMQILLLCICAILSSYFFMGNFLIRQLFNVIIVSAVMYWHIHISYKKSVFLAMLYEGLLLSSDYIAFSINTKLFSSKDMISQDYGTEGMLVTLFGKTILFLCILFIRKSFDKKTTDMLADSEWIRFLIFPTFTIVVISAMLSSFKYVETPRQADVLFIIAFGMAGLNIVVFYLIQNIVEREIRIRENEVFQIQVSNQMNMYRSISESFDNQKRKTHEYKNQILCIESMLGKKQYSELETYVMKLYGKLNDETDVINTNHVIINAILNTKYQETMEKGIVFVFKVNDLSDLEICDEDVVTILANLLNNAIEACEKCTDKKIIKLKFIKKEDKTIISVKNTYNDTICYENGEIRTTKLLKPEEHGVGIKNVLKLIEKYNGSYVIQEQNKEFFFSIIIPSSNTI
jgi:hypothetical protein